MKQRLLLSLCAILCSVATWAVTFSSGQFKYSASGSTAEITGYNSSYSSSQLQNLVIPHTVTYNGTTYRVSKVGGLGASAYPKTVRVEYGEYDVTINKDAFKGCSNLTTVELTSCVYQILADAFKDCSKLKEVYVSKQSALLGSAAIFNSKVTVYINYYQAVQKSRKHRWEYSMLLQLCLILPLIGKMVHYICFIRCQITYILTALNKAVEIKKSVLYPKQIVM